VQIHDIAIGMWLNNKYRTKLFAR